jgi:hypothetical protein
MILIIIKIKIKVKILKIIILKRIQKIEINRVEFYKNKVLFIKIKKLEKQ